MPYIGKQPDFNTVGTDELTDNAVTNAKIVDDISFTSITGSVVSASTAIVAGVYSGGVMSGSAQTAINLPTGTVSASMGISGSAVSTGSFGRVEATRLSGDGADITGISAGISHDGSTADGVLTYKDADEATVEANLTFDGTDLTVETGDIVFGTAGKGICLGVTSNTDSNTLDDYEEGTWTAAVVEVAGGGDTALTMRAGEDTGYYTKVGNLVTVSGFFGTSSLNGLSSEMVRITGLPFTVADNDAALSGGGAAYATGNGITAGESSAYYGQRGDTYIHLTVWDATSGTSAMQASEWGADGRIIIGFSYRAA
jgi:hypothetical protein